MTPDLLPRYPGSPPFPDSEMGRLLFRGRRDEAEQLTHAILSNDLIVVYGVSGTGKTSLLQAGVFERLRDEDLWPCVVRLNDPSHNHVDLVAGRLEQQAESDGLEINRLHEASDLWDLLAALEIWRDDSLLTPVLVFDQFEELFTLDWPTEARSAFIQEFGWVTRGYRPIVGDRATGPAPPLKAVIAIREDALGDLEELATDVPHIMRSRFRLRSLDLDEAEIAIRGPALLEDERLQSPPFEYGDDAVELLLTFLSTRQIRGKRVTTDAVEPSQLQIICQYIEEALVLSPGAAATPREITADDLGGEEGLNEILRDFYRRQIATLATSVQNRVRRLCEEELISARGHRLSLEVGEIATKFLVEPALLDLEQRLLRAEPRTGSTYYELAHDSLVAPILSFRLDALYARELDRLNPMQRSAVRALCEQGLITPAGTRNVLNEDVVQWVYDVERDVLDGLCAAGLLQSLLRDGEVYYEIAEDRLLGQILSLRIENELESARTNVSSESVGDRQSTVDTLFSLLSSTATPAATRAEANELLNTLTGDDEPKVRHEARQARSILLSGREVSLEEARALAKRRAAVHLFRSPEFWVWSALLATFSALSAFGSWALTREVLGWIRPVPRLAGSDWVPWMVGIIWSLIYISNFVSESDEVSGRRSRRSWNLGKVLLTPFVPLAEGFGTEKLNSWPTHFILTWAVPASVALAAHSWFGWPFSLIYYLVIPFAVGSAGALFAESVWGWEPTVADGKGAIDDEPASSK